MAQAGALQLWGGIECTINRVGNRFFSQLELNGHISRLDDLERIAALGIRTLRYPVLWEQLAPRSLAEIDWTWADERLNKLRELGIRPIVGLVHHGSGPRYTSLLDPDFPLKLAQFARAVAERYPWVDAFTPVNEPLTTARFSGLYGHWYPHGHDEQTFARCLLNQVRGVVLAMRAIREVNSRAELVQTDDLGKTFSTPSLRYQADFENERRWITWDLLCGDVQAGHRMWHHLLSTGVAADEIDWFAANPSPPDIVGANYYMTSERFLDSNIAAYPAHCHGGNGRHVYADVEAVRVARGIDGPQKMLAEVCQRYGLPVAVTEAHIGCTPDEQLRWLNEIWQSAKALRDAGHDVPAVTVWSLFGAHSWNALLTCDDGEYECGAFDVSNGTAREAPLATVIRALARDGELQHPAVETPGWWHHSSRVVFHLAEHEPDTAIAS